MPLSPSYRNHVRATLALNGLSLETIPKHFQARHLWNQCKGSMQVSGMYLKLTIISTKCFNVTFDHSCTDIIYLRRHFRAQSLAFNILVPSGLLRARGKIPSSKVQISNMDGAVVHSTSNTSEINDIHTRNFRTTTWTYLFDNYL